MNMINICLDYETIEDKEYAKEHIKDINKRIAQLPITTTLENIAKEVGEKGKTFTPAQFTMGKRKSECFKSMQLFPLDFDEGISYVEMGKKAKEYGLPIAFAYKTLSYSETVQKYRIVFCLDVKICHRNVAEFIISMLLDFFPEADSACKDVSRMYLGGKGLLNEECSILKLKDCIEHFQYHKKLKDHNYNFRRDMMRLANKYGIGMKNGYIEFEEINQENLKLDGIKDSANYIFIENTQNPSYFYVLGKLHKEDETASQDAFHKKIQSGIRRYRKNMLSYLPQTCELLHAMIIDGSSISHEEKMGLVTNLRFIDGGTKYFLSLLSQISGSNLEKWKYDINYIKDHDYKPYNCCTFCRYANNCDHAHTILETLDRKRRVEKIYESHYCTIEEAEKNFQDNFNDVMDLADMSLHVIQAQTALGKTECYCRYIQEHYSLKKFFVAVPTLKLKGEVFCRLKEKGVPVVKSVSLNEFENIPKKILGQLQDLCCRGYYKEARKELKKYIKNCFFESEKELKELRKKMKEYSMFVEVLRGAEADVVVSTHAQFLHLPADALEQYQIIIDEDILFTICNSGKVIQEKDIHILLDNCILHGEQRKALLKLCEMSVDSPLVWKDATPFINIDIAEANNICSNFNGLKEGCILWREKGKKEYEDIFHYYYPYKLCNQKIVILTATGNEDIYRGYFNERTVDYRICKKAKISGKILQYPYYSCSRRKLQEKGYGKIKEEIRKIIGDIPVVTFKKYGEGIFHFGNTEGSNEYAGCDIGVIGTPHVNEIAYYMLAYAIDPDVMLAKPNYRKIRFGDYSFHFMSYKDVLMQKIQKYYISTSLEQAVGRARVLRNNNTVYVFSDFPVEQAEFCNIDYLNNASVG